MTIVICTECDGIGQICRDIGTHKSEYRYYYCGKCKGSGRLIETVETIHKPFIPGGIKSKRVF